MKRPDSSAVPPITPAGTWDWHAATKRRRASGTIRDMKGLVAQTIRMASRGKGSAWFGLEMSAPNRDTHHHTGADQHQILDDVLTLERRNERNTGKDLMGEQH